MGKREIQCVSAAGVIAVVPTIIGNPVVAGVVDATEAHSGTSRSFLGGVVVHDVENDLESRFVVSLHQRLELVDLFALGSRGCVFAVRREEADCVVAPVIRHPDICEMFLGHRLLDRKQLNRCHAKVHQVFDDTAVCHAGICAAEVHRDIGMHLREALDVRFVQHGVGPRYVWASNSVPIEVTFGDDAVRHIWRRVTIIHLRVVFGGVRVEFVREYGGVVLQLTGDCARVRIQQQLVRIPACTVRWIPRTMNPEAVLRADAMVRNESVVDAVGALRKPVAGLGAVVVTNAEIHGIGPARPQGNVQTPVADRHAQWIRQTGFHRFVGQSVHWSPLGQG